MLDWEDPSLALLDSSIENPFRNTINFDKKKNPSLERTGPPAENVYVHQKHFQVS